LCAIHERTSIHSLTIGARMVEFSVVIPVYNKEPHVARALQSVFAQSFPAKEVLVIDDASTDRSIAVVKEVGGDRIRLLRRDAPGAGGYHARNLGIREATAQWIAFLDADDEWRPDHLAALCAGLEGAPDTVGCVFAAYAAGVAPENGGPTDFIEQRAVDRRSQLDLEGFLQLWLDLGRCPVNTSGIAFKRDILLAAGGFPGDRCKRGGDKDMWLRACAMADAIALPDVTSVYYRDSVNMVTREASQNLAHCMCKSIAELRIGSNRHRRALLEQLHNHEVFRYAVLSWRKGEIDPAQFRAYFGLRDPIGFLHLQFMKLVPERAVRGLRPWLRRLRSRLAPGQRGSAIG